MASNLCDQQIDIPQWKRDLILRRRNQNRQSSLSENNSCSSSSNAVMSGARSNHQHSPTSCSGDLTTADVADVVGTSNCSRSLGQQPSPTIGNIDVQYQYRSNSPKQCVIQATSPVPHVPATTMVQERSWNDHGVNVLVKKTTTTTVNNHPPNTTITMGTNGSSRDKNNIDSDSSEELQYGPGIVNKLKNRYMSLTLRETSNRRNRPSILSILHMRKAASLENLLEDNSIKAPINIRGFSNGNSVIINDGLHPPHPYERSNSNNHRPVNGTSTASSNGTSTLDATATTAVRNASNRYRKPARGHDLIMKRAHSVETISLHSTEDNLLQDTEIVSRRQRCESMYDNNLLLIRPEDGNYNKKETSVINDYQNAAKVKKIFDSGVAVNNIPTPRLNRPTKIKPIMNEKEKPPADVVRETKKKFEGRPDLRTRPPHQTGEVAAKIATYSNIIVKTKVSKMPLASKYHKTNVINKNWTDKKESKPLDLNLDHKWPNNTLTKTLNSPDVAMVSPIPDVSRVMDTFEKFDRDNKVNSSLCETPDLLIHSSPVHTTLQPQSIHINEVPLFNNGRVRQDSNSTNSSQPLSPASECSEDDSSSEDTINSMRIDLENKQNLSAAANSEAFNFNTIQVASGSFLPTVDKKPPTTPHHKLHVQYHQHLPHTEPLHVEVSNDHKTVPKQSYDQFLKKSPTTDSESIPVLSPISPTLTSREIEKNNINAAKSREVVSSVPVLVVDSNVPKINTANTNVVPNAETLVKNVVPKPKKSIRQPEDTTTLFDFTHRNDVPDYIRNDGTTRNIDIPKSKDSGTTLLPGYEEDLDIDMSSPPSPCDVTFINDNILISGRSSISKRSTKRASLQKIRLQFNSSPEVFEYPSEKSILGEEKEEITSPTVGHTVPLLSGSTLANYQPKSGFAIEDFQLGVTKTTTVSTNASSGTSQDGAKTENQTQSEVHEPIMFSAGTNSDILF